MEKVEPSNCIEGYGMEKAQPGMPPVEGYGMQPMQQQPPVIYQQPAGGVLQQPQQPAGASPNGMNWMPAPVTAPLGCPPGLEYLTMVDELIVKQQIDMVEVFTDFETNNRYLINNTAGQQVYFAVEDTDCCTRQLFKAGRAFEMKILDNLQREVLHFSRPLKCRGACCECATQEINMFSPPGNPIGRVFEKNVGCSLWPAWIVSDGAGQQIFEIAPLSGLCICCEDIPFTITSIANGAAVGCITKQWTGHCSTETCTQATSFSIKFPMDLDVKLKANIIGAMFLIDFMYYEKK